ncbi:MAG: hypothetical protein MR966_15280 [Lachnospiraceae bacterium]|nr:hypothetical protein [Lachnospiraceae bacterium]
MKKDRKISYLINAAGILVLFLLFYAVFQSGVLGIRTTYIKGICTTACYTIVMVTSLNLLVGFMGEFSLGHAGFMSVGAYMSAVFTTMMADSGIPELLLFIMALLIGGTGSLTGSIIGAAFLSALPEVMRQFANYRILAYSIVLVLVMIFKPGGIFGKWEFSLTRALAGLADLVKGGKSKKQMAKSGEESGKQTAGGGRNE